MLQTTAFQGLAQGTGVVAAVLTVAIVASVAVGAVPAQAWAQTAPAQPAAPAVTDVVVHPWVTTPPSRTPDSYISNLKDRQEVESPLVLRFGLSMRGIVPAGKTAGKSGHHHLLVNQELPLDFTKPLPFTDKYIHFGKGQMETVLDVPPGQYTLRMLLADQGHIPYFVYSKPITIKVLKQNKDVKPDSLLGPARIEVLSPAQDSQVQAPFRIQFHASGYNISHTGPKVAGTGYFRLSLERSGHKTEVLNFTAGQTEVWLTPPVDAYTAKLELISTTSGEVMSKAAPVAFKVVGR